MNTRTVHSPRPYTRTRRRSLVVIQYVGLVATILTYVLTDGLLGVLLCAPLAIATLVSFFLLSRPRLIGTSDLGDRELDERQIQVRNSGYFTAYQILAPMIALLVIYPQIAVEFELWLPTTDDERSAVIWCTLGFLITLPGSILAWTEPDPR